MSNDFIEKRVELMSENARNVDEEKVGQFIIQAKDERRQGTEKTKRNGKYP